MLVLSICFKLNHTIIGLWNKYIEYEKVPIIPIGLKYFVYKCDSLLSKTRKNNVNKEIKNVSSTKLRSVLLFIL